jgi:hypothetical protein
VARAPGRRPRIDAALREADDGDSGSIYDMIDSLEGVAEHVTLYLDELRGPGGQAC